MADIDPNSWLLFERVATNGSFSAAARELGVAKGTVSKAVSALESRLGAALFHRSSRQVVLSATGERLLPHARALRLAAEAASEAAAEEAEGLAGRIRLAAPLSFGMAHMGATLAAFQAEYPAVEIELCLDDAVTDLLAGGYDIALRIGTLSDSSLRMRRLGTVRLSLVAAPAWVAAHGAPAGPDALDGGDGLLYANAAAPGAWRLQGPDGRVADVRPRPRLTANNGDILRDAACAGLGVALLPDFLAAEPVADGRLVRLLPGWSGPPRDLVLLSPPGVARPARVTMLMNHLGEALARRCHAAASSSDSW